MGIIKINNLTKYYGNIKGIENLNFEVNAGEIYGFIGPNGAGKSTTIRTILNLIKANDGFATIFGLDSVKDHEEIMNEIGYLPSEVFYYDNMKALDLLQYSESFYKIKGESRINELASLLELDLDRKIEDLSYGNRKKVGIIQALLHSPKLIILDEPTSGLDPFIQQKFFDLLRKEKEKGTTIFFSSHVLSEVQKICDKVAIIKDGGIVEAREIKLLHKENYKHFVIETIEELNFNHLKELDIKNFHHKKNTVDFMYNGNLNNIMSLIATFDIKNITITDPSLEEIFMHYYGEE